RGDYAARAGGSLNLSTKSGSNSGGSFGWVGAAARCNRIVWSDVVRRITKHARAGAAHGAWCACFQRVEAGGVSWVGADCGRRGPRGCGGSGIDAADGKLVVQGQPARPTGIWISAGNDDGCGPSRVSVAGVAGNADGSGASFAQLMQE